LVITTYACSSTTNQQGTSKCIETKIEEFQEEPLANPPIEIYQYFYNGNLVYFVSAPCCDMYTTLYDENCNIICYPSGGITGEGDGRCNDFFETRSDEKLIWKDDRKN
jgi:hypothetical protein